MEVVWGSQRCCMEVVNLLIICPACLRSEWKSLWAEVVELMELIYVETVV